MRNLIDATPIGANVRSTVATYADVHDELRRAFARTDEAPRRAAGRRAISRTTPAACAAPRATAPARSRLTCSSCRTWTIECPDCGGSRYAPEADAIRRAVKGESHLSLSLPQLDGDERGPGSVRDRRPQEGSRTSDHDFGCYTQIDLYVNTKICFHLCI